MQPEELKFDLKGKRTLVKTNKQKDRLIYEVKEEIVTVFVIAAMGHSFDK